MESKPPRVVLVDDDADFLAINRSIFDGEGYEVLCFSDPEEALRSMVDAPPAAVVTDLMMGRLDSGFSLARRIKEDSRLQRVPVIIVSGITRRRGFDFRPLAASELADMHADAFFDKPVDPAALIAKVKELLGT